MTALVFLDTELTRRCPECGSAFQVNYRKSRKRFCGYSCSNAADRSPAGGGVMDPLTWMESAHCAHPLWRDRDIPTQRAVCAGCPVSAQCLSRALETIRALTPSERSEVRADPKPDVWAGQTICELIDAGEWPKRNRARRAPGKVFDSPVRYCPRGHDTHEVGRYANYRCAQCQREAAAAKRKAAA